MSPNVSRRRPPPRSGGSPDGSSRSTSVSSQAPALSNQGVQDTVISQVTPEAPSVLDAFEAEMPSSAEKERRSTEFTERMEDAAVAVDDLKDQVVVAGQEHGRRGFLK